MDLKPRCGKVMLRYEAVWGALPDAPVCGRPEGHKERCRSVQSLKRAKAREKERWPVIRERRRARKQKLRDLAVSAPAAQA